MTSHSLLSKRGLVVVPSRDHRGKCEGEKPLARRLPVLRIARRRRPKGDKWLAKWSLEVNVSDGGTDFTTNLHYALFITLHTIFWS